jgi:hypothetical protein
VTLIGAEGTPPTQRLAGALAFSRATRRWHVDDVPSEARAGVG